VPVASRGGAARTVETRGKPLTWRRRLRRRLRGVLRGAVGLLGPPALRALSRTWRVTIEGDEGSRALEAEGKGFLIALWHGRMLLGLAQHGAREWSVLVSRSGDGDLSNALLERFGYRIVRGSAGRHGTRAAREMLSSLQSGTGLVITPDGPRGPRHSMNPGIAWMARTAGYPILPVGFACDRAWRAKSWDRFTIPKPWSRVAMVFGPVIRPGPAEGDDSLEELTERIRQGILRAEERGAALLDVEPDW